MSESDDFELNKPDPGTETLLRFTTTRETRFCGDDVQIDPPRWKIGDIVEGYVLEKLIGSGVTSSVYLAREAESGRRCALKLLRSRNEEVMAACRVGFRRMLTVSHPGLVRVYRLIGNHGVIGFTMEYVPGRRLSKAMNDARAAGRAAVFDLAHRLLRDVGGALQAINDAGLVHRDVKPDNILIDDHGRARLVDYGLVGSFDPESDPDARRDYLAGTYWYMAPESISMQIYPPACDVYALGCILLELLADHSALPSDANEAVSLGQSVGDVRKFLPSDTPPELCELLCDMVDPATENRPLAARLVHVGLGLTTQPNKLGFHRGYLYGRESQMAAAERWVQSVVKGRPTRLHLFGDSGVGKSWFLAELLRRIRQNRWFQVFDANCRERAEASLQVFGTMADAIARRYSRSDRDVIRLQPRHARVLRQAFPVLRSVIEPPPEADDGKLADHTDWDPRPDESPDQSELNRADALSSGVDLVDRMCEYGPLFLVIDDVQWADQDSLNVLDKLIADAERMTGIITIGRETQDRFRCPADCIIELGPLSEHASIDLLREILCQTDPSWTDAALCRLAHLGEGNAYQLTQLAACMRLDDAAVWQQRLLTESIQIEDIWQTRLDSLSPESRVSLEYLAIAGGPIRPADLGRVSDLLERCDEVLQELAEHRLVRDESSRSELVDIVHQRIGQCVAAAIPKRRRRELHQRWASYLMTCEQDPWRAARIAGHLLEADKPIAAVPHVIQAARDAEARFAFTEAARWHHRAASILSPPQSLQSLLQAISRYEDACQYGEAAELCHDLLSRQSLDPQAVEYQRIMIRFSINRLREGRPIDARNLLSSLVQSQTRSTIDVASLLSVYRPMMSIDIEMANTILEACAASEQLLTDAHLAFRVALETSLRGCRKRGSRRRRCTEQLKTSLHIAELVENSSLRAMMTADASRAIAVRHLLACDWASSIAPATRAIHFFSLLGPNYRFDEAHAHIPLVWSFLWLGRLRELGEVTLELTRHLQERNDEFMIRMARTGLGVATALINDDDEMAAPRLLTVDSSECKSSMPMMEVLDGFANVLKRIYRDEPAEGIALLNHVLRGTQQKLVSQVELFDVLTLQLEAVCHLRIACTRPTCRVESIDQVELICKSLTEHRIPHARTIARFYAAQAQELVGNTESCLVLYKLASEDADSLDLLPFRLASIDRLNIINGEKTTGELRQFLRDEGVAQPDRFARLYCGLC